DLAIAVSRYNEAELRQAGFARTVVVPLFVDLGGTEREGGPARAGLSAAPAPAPATGPGGARWLFVGRLIPNKAQHDLIKALAAYRRLYDPGATLDLVGKPMLAGYAGTLHRFAAAAGVGGAVRFLGSVGPAGLARLYRQASVVVCLSDHEGFCAPLVEAMGHGVPVIAFDAAAVAETVGGAGVVLADKAPVRVAAAVQRVLRDAGLRAALVARGRARAAEFSIDRTAARLQAVVEDFLARRGDPP
ncbi:MAG: glycosyltransferase family 4 protein, partial [Acidimicrobiales bacterium]